LTRWASARYDGRVRRRAGRLLETGACAWADLLSSLSWSSIDLGEVVEDVPELMRSYGFRSYDAVHAASLGAADLSDMATLDHGFAALPQHV
jgi:predicted nucleic acid-binding protein